MIREYIDCKKQRSIGDNMRYEMNKVINCDCLEYMRECKDNEFDLAIVDPPYGLNIDGQKKSICNNPKHNRKEHIFKGWDNKTPDKKYFDELFRVSKNQIIFGGNYFVKYLDVHKGWVIWDKGQRGLTMSDCELIYTTFDKPTRIYKENRNFLNIEKSIHPTQKPIKLYKWLLENYSKPYDKIFDSHVGSGSSRIACYELGYDFVGCELDKDYWEAQEKRFELEKNRIDNKFYIPEEENLLWT